MKNNFKQFIRQITPISDKEFYETVILFKEIHLEKGDYFVKQGNICRQIAFINKGTLRTFYINNKAKETTSCFCLENNLTTSYKSFIQQQPSRLSIKALELTELLAINYENLQKLYDTSVVWQKIGRVFAECKFWEHPDTHSGNIRTAIPETSGHLFWDYPDIDSGNIRTLN